jgi:hypothetical protein
MHRWRMAAGLSALALMVAGRVTLGQQRAPAVEPEAVAALNRMGTFLRSLMSLAVNAQSTTDEVLESGQKIQLGATMDLRARRSDRLRADVDSDRKSRRFFYDGKNFTLYGPRSGYYATTAAPPTTRELIEVAGRRYGLEFPLADLFYWGTDKSGVKDLRSAISLGRSTVTGVQCDHFAFRQAGVDWQIWIERGQRPVPRKLVVTSIDEPSQPQYVVVLDWTLNPPLEDQLFTFVPPPGAHPIAFQTVEESAPAPTRQGRTIRSPKGAKP